MRAHKQVPSAEQTALPPHTHSTHTSGGAASRASFTLRWNRGKSSRRRRRSAFITRSVRLKPDMNALGASLKARRKPYGLQGGNKGVCVCVERRVDKGVVWS